MPSILDMSPEEIEELHIEILDGAKGERYGVCPHCFQNINVGSAGAGNLKSRHLLKKSCREARQKFDAKARVKPKVKAMVETEVETTAEKVKETVKKAVKKAVTIGGWLTAGPRPQLVPSTVGLSTVGGQSTTSTPAVTVTVEDSDDDDASTPLASPSSTLTAAPASAPASAGTTVVNPELSLPADIVREVEDVPSTQPQVHHAAKRPPAREPYPDNIIAEMALLIPLIPESVATAKDFDPIAKGVSGL